MNQSNFRPVKFDVYAANGQAAKTVSSYKGA